MTTSSLPPIAFLGLGAMGHGMAINLLSKQYPLIGYDISSFSLDRFTTSAAPFTPTLPEHLTATTPLAAVKGARIVIFMVATAAQIKSALFEGDNAAVHGLEKGATVLLCTTGPLGYAGEIEEKTRVEYKRGDVRWVDCPVSGGAKRARDGTLTILASGEESVLRDGEVKGVLEACAGGNLWVIEGGLGRGTMVKMVHQVLAGIHIAMTAEVVGFWGRVVEEEQKEKGEGKEGKEGKEGGAEVDLKSVLEVVKNGMGWSWMFENRVGHLLEKEGEGKGTVYSALNIIVKDVGIITSASRTLTFPVFLTSTTEQVLATGVTSGLGLIDDSLLFQTYLPNQPSLVSKLSSPSSSSTSSSRHPKLHLLENIMAAVHTIAAAEALCLGKRVGLDMEQLFRIIEGAAGSSRVFVERGREIITGRWRGARTVGGIVEQLKEALDEANRLRYPLHLTATALQLFELAAVKGWEKEKDVIVTRVWDGKEGSWFPCLEQGNY